MERDIAKIGLVLPDRSFRDLLAEILFAEGFDVHCFESAVAAAAAVDGSNRFVFLFDPSTPETEPDLLLSLLEKEGTRDTRIILLGMTDVPLAPASAHVVASIELPFDLDELVRLIRDASRFETLEDTG